MKAIATVATTLVALVVAGDSGSASERDDRTSAGRYSRDYYENNVVQQAGDRRLYRTSVTFDTRPPGCTPVGGPYFECYGQILEYHAGQYIVMQLK